LLALALGQTLAIVLLGNAAANWAAERPAFDRHAFGLMDAPDVAVLHLLITGLPMLVLAAIGSRRALLWAVALGFAIAAWGFAIWQIHQDFLNNFAGGADIGLGVVMLASPFVSLLVLLIVGLIDLAIRRLRRPRSLVAAQSSSSSS
jgi:hypothetical protein